MGGLMTAEPIAEHGHHWHMPPQDGYTVDDLFTLPDLPRHTELIDGSLVLVSPQRRFHFLMIDLLVSGLRATIPDHLKVCRDMTVVLDKRNAPEPDISVVQAKAVTDLGQARYEAADVVLAVEVVSPESESRDRDTKFHKYATFGIRHYWLVEGPDVANGPVVRSFELDPKARTYAPTGVHREQLKLADPFDVSIDISLDALNRL
jgi:Uma2 family endonuclease